MVTGGGDLRTDDGAGQAGASLKIGVWPEEAVFKDGTSFDDGVGANDVVAYQGGGGVDWASGWMAVRPSGEFACARWASK